MTGDETLVEREFRTRTKLGARHSYLAEGGDFLGADEY